MENQRGTPTIVDVVPVSDISAVITRADGRRVDLGLLSFSDSNRPLRDLLLRGAVWLKVKYYGVTGRRLLPGIIP
jgi:hypothetical protein